jgi:hypothetical protein
MRRTTVSRSTPHERCGNDSNSRCSRLRGSSSSPRQLAWLCVQPSANLTPLEAATLVRLEQDAEAARVVPLVRCFVQLVHERGVTRGAKPMKTCRPFEQWFKKARTCGVRAVGDVRVGTRAGRRGCASRADHALEQCSSRRTDNEAQTSQASNVRSSQFQFAAPSHVARGMSGLKHIKCGRATKAEQSHLPPKALGLSQRRSRMTAFRRRQGLLSSSDSPSKR